jgi:phosphohistidine phosphatase SixA
MLKRRPLLFAGVAWPVRSATSDHDAVAALLRGGGVVMAFRHALAPGTSDPPGFRAGVCSTQRNLDDEGRAQARRIGSWFRAAGLQPARVRSSPWCRCLDTAMLAFGQAEPWSALGSPHGATETTHAESLDELRRALVGAAPGTGFEVWVTHQLVLSRLVGGGTASGEGLVLRADASGAPKLLARLNAA